MLIPSWRTKTSLLIPKLTHSNLFITITVNEPAPGVKDLENAFVYIQKMNLRNLRTLQCQKLSVATLLMSFCGLGFGCWRHIRVQFHWETFKDSYHKIIGAAIWSCWMANGSTSLGSYSFQSYLYEEQKELVKLVDAKLGQGSTLYAKKALY